MGGTEGRGRKSNSRETGQGGSSPSSELLRTGWSGQAALSSAQGPTHSGDRRVGWGPVPSGSTSLCQTGEHAGQRQRGTQGHVRASRNKGAWASGTVRPRVPAISLLWLFLRALGRGDGALELAAPLLMPSTAHMWRNAVKASQPVHLPLSRGAGHPTHPAQGRAGQQELLFTSDV